MMLSTHFCRTDLMSEPAQAHNHLHQHRLALQRLECSSDIGCVAPHVHSFASQLPQSHASWKTGADVYESLHVPAATHVPGLFLTKGA